MTDSHLKSDSRLLSLSLSLSSFSTNDQEAPFSTFFSLFVFRLSNFRFRFLSFSLFVKTPFLPSIHHNFPEGKAIIHILGFLSFHKFLERLLRMIFYVLRLNQNPIRDIVCRNIASSTELDKREERERERK
jgi:hypothetical protein